MLVDVKRDRDFWIRRSTSREDYIKFLKEIGEWKLSKIQKGFYHACLNVHMILEETIKDEYPKLTVPIKGYWFSSTAGHEYFPAKQRKTLKPTEKNLSQYVTFLMYGANPWVLPPYGVCDSPDQFIDRYEKGLEEDPRRLFVTFYRVAKANEPPKYGWRWRKWGPYIGDKTPQHEYLAEEDESFVSIYCYHVRVARQRRWRKERYA